MKSFSLSLGMLLLLFSSLLFAQYPDVTIEEIQYQDSLSLITNGDLPSPYDGQTVKVRGVVMVTPLVDPENDRRRILAAGGGWVTYLQDPDGQMYDAFDGINVLQFDTVGVAQNTFFDLIDTAQVFEITLTVDEYYETTQGAVLTSPVTEVTLLQQLPKRPDPIELNISDFNNGSMNVLAEKYEGMYVILRNVITSERNQATGTFKINDANGNYMYMYDQSGYFTLRGHRLTGLTNYEPPVDGSLISYIRGVIATWWTGSSPQGYRIIPIYPGDIGEVLANPPNISNLRRSLAHVMTNQPVTITANIEDFDGSVDSAKLFYRVDGGTYTEVNMSFISGFKYSADIPGVNSDSALVDYYIWAKDNEGNIATLPLNFSDVRYFYLVLNRDLTIQDVQYNPFGTDFSGYDGYRVTLTGIVTADTTDFPGGNYALRIYMQNGQGPWSGIWIGTRGTNGSQVYDLDKGQKVTISGTVWEYADYLNSPTGYITRLDSATNVNVISSGIPLPNPEVIQTDTIGLGGNGVIKKEQWESVILRFEDVLVTMENADSASGSNYGEMMVNDGSGNTRVLLEDGRHDYHNLSDPTRLYYVKTGSTFEALQGILYYSFDNYKLVPRNNGDFIGYTAVSVENEGTIPTQFGLFQNYPNPFNPSTTIKFSLLKESSVRLSVYNLLGEEVNVLLNNEVQSAGSYNLRFDASRLSSGIYFYRLIAVPVDKSDKSFVDVKKMILLK